MKESAASQDSIAVRVEKASCYLIGILGPTFTGQKAGYARASLNEEPRDTGDG